MHMFLGTIYCRYTLSCNDVCCHPWGSTLRFSVNHFIRRIRFLMSPVRHYYHLILLIVDCRLRCYRKSSMYFFILVQYIQGYCNSTPAISFYNVKELKWQRKGMTYNGYTRIFYAWYGSYPYTAILFLFDNNMDYVQ